jgi:hypothetical protein
MIAAACALALAALAAGEARAQDEPVSSPEPSSAPPPPTRHFGGQRILGVGPTLGFYDGLGALMVIGGDPVGAVVSGGYAPVLIFGNQRLNKSITFDYYTSGQLNLDLLVAPWHVGKRTDLGIVAGYKYNSVLAHGFGVGFAAFVDLSATLALSAGVGFAGFPGAEDHLRQNQGYPTDRDPAIPWFQGGVQIALLVYP